MTTDELPNHPLYHKKRNQGTVMCTVYVSVPAKVNLTVRCVKL